MYVIYPAEEIISLTYGVAAAVPRPILQRPTLDNLREPLVPVVGTRTPSPASVHHPSSSSTTNKSQKNISSNNNNHRQSIHVQNNNNPNVFINDNKNCNIDTSDFDENITLNTFNGDRVTNYYTPPSSPSLGPGTSATSTPPITADKPPISTTAKGKQPTKSKLQLKFAKLGRPHSNPEPAESARVLEYHDIRVSNPTFTRDNLRQRNFDAFFESGEPVYSIETKEKTSSPASTEPSPIDDSLFLQTTTTTPPKQKSKLNFLKRNKQSSQTNKPPPLPSRRGSRSSDILLIVEEPQKGDRCTPLMILIALVL